MTEPTPPEWPHEPIAPGWVRTPESRYYYWEPETHSWRAASILVIGKLVDDLRAALDAERQRTRKDERIAEQIFQEVVLRKRAYDVLRHERDAALARAEAADRQVAALRSVVERFIGEAEDVSVPFDEWCLICRASNLETGTVRPAGRAVPHYAWCLVLEAAEKIAATAPPEPSAPERRSE